jgi:hypothetical protein
VYSEKQVAMEDIFAPLVYGFLQNVYKMCCSGFKNGKVTWFYKSIIRVLGNRVYVVVLSDTCE